MLAMVHRVIQLQGGVCTSTGGSNAEGNVADWEGIRF